MSEKLEELERAHAADPANLPLLEALLRARERAGAGASASEVAAALYDLAVQSDLKLGLARVRSLGVAAVPELSRALSSEDTTLRRQSIQALASLRDQAAAGTAALAALLDSPADGVERRAAAEALAAIGPAAIGALDALRRGLSERDWELRAICAAALGELGPLAAPARALLEQARQGDEDEDVRAAARLALEKLDSSTEERTPRLLRELTSDDLMTREASLEQLSEMRRLAPELAEALRAAYEARRACEPQFARRCFELLTRASPDEAFGLLAENLGEADSELLVLLEIALAAEPDRARYIPVFVELIAGAFDKLGRHLRQIDAAARLLGPERARLEAELRRRIEAEPADLGALVYLNMFGRETEAVAAALIRELGSGRGDVRLAIQLESAARHAPRAIPVDAVLAIIPAQPERIRQALFAALVSVDSDESWRAILSLVEGPGRKLRREAARWVSYKMRPSRVRSFATQLKRLRREVREADALLYALFKRRAPELLDEGRASEPEPPTQE